MCLKHWTRSLIWNCPLNPQFPRQIRTTWDRSGAVATRIRASDQVAPLHLSLLLGSDGPVFWCASLTSWVLAKKRLHMVNKNIPPRTSCPTFFLVDDVSTYAGLLYVLSRDCWEGFVFVQAFWVCLKMDYVLPPTWQFIRKWWDNDEKPVHWKIDGLAYFQTNPF